MFNWDNKNLGVPSVSIFEKKSQGQSSKCSFPESMVYVLTRHVAMSLYVDPLLNPSVPVERSCPLFGLPVPFSCFWFQALQKRHGSKLSKHVEWDGKSISVVALLRAHQLGVKKQQIGTLKSEVLSGLTTQTVVHFSKISPNLNQILGFKFSDWSVPAPSGSKDVPFPFWLPPRESPCHPGSFKKTSAGFTVFFSQDLKIRSQNHQLPSQVVNPSAAAGFCESPAFAPAPRTSCLSIPSN